MKDFQFKSPAKIVFGNGSSADLAKLITPLGAKKAFVVTGKHVGKLPEFARVVESLRAGGIECVTFDDTENDPSVRAVDAAAKALRESGCDSVIAVGGGSVIDTAKAIAMLASNAGSIRDYLFGGTKTPTAASMPLVCVPTTAGSGSEVTASSVVTDEDNDIKLSVTHPSIVPVYAVIDPTLHAGMPASVTASTGMDALTHAIEAYVSLNANPVSDAYATQAIAAISANIRTATFNPGNLEARSEMAVASSMAAIAFMNGGLGAVHGIAQSMGGVAHVAHGIANAILLPYVMEINLAGNPAKFAKIADLMGETPCGSTRATAEKAVAAVKTLCADIRIPAKLSAVGVRKDQFDAIVKGTMGYRLLAVNPVKLREQDVYDILERAL